VRLVALNIDQVFDRGFLIRDLLAVLAVSLTTTLQLLNSSFLHRHGRRSFEDPQADDTHSRAEQSRAEQSRAEHSKAEQSTAEQSRAE